MARRYARPGLTEVQYFNHYAMVTDHGLEWTGPMNGKYGRMANKTYAHRYSWTHFRGPIEDTDIVDHMHPECPKTCITPGHLTIQKSRTDHMNAGWERGEYATTWATRKQNPQDPTTGRFIKAVR